MKVQENIEVHMRITRRIPTATSRRRNRSGVSSLDYILVIGVILPLATIVIPTGMRMIRLVYDMMTVQIAWPFL